MLKSRLLRLLLWTAAALGVLWVLAWFGVPALLKWQLESRGSQALGRELRVGEVRFVPHALALTLRDLSVAGADAAAPPQLHIDRIFVDLDVRSLWRLAPVVEALEIDAPHARLTRLAPGRYDIDDLLARFGRAVEFTVDPGAEPFVVEGLRIHRHTTRRSAVPAGLPWPSSSPRKVARARHTRDITVPTGMCITSATSA